jgi:hypothetical protein
MNLGAAKACAQRVRDKLHRLARSLPGREAVEHEAPDRNETVLSHVTERSILQAPNIAEFIPFAVAGRARRATCSGVAWFKGYHLAVVNLYGGHLRVYRFHPGDRDAASARLELLHEISDGIESPEDVAVSPDGKLLAGTRYPRSTASRCSRSIRAHWLRSHLVRLCGRERDTRHSTASTFLPIRGISCSARSRTPARSRWCEWHRHLESVRAFWRTDSFR